MEAMRARGITKVLTHDHHFAREGFVVRLKRQCTHDLSAANDTAAAETVFVETPHLT